MQLKIKYIIPVVTILLIFVSSILFRPIIEGYGPLLILLISIIAIIFYIVFQSQFTILLILMCVSPTMIILSFPLNYIFAFSILLITGISLDRKVNKIESLPIGIFSVMVFIISFIKQMEILFILMYIIFFAMIIYLGFVIYGFRKKHFEMKSELKYIDARKNILDINPFSINKQNVIMTENNALRIMEHISEAIKTLIKMLSMSIKLKSIVYLVYDKKEKMLYPELGISDEDLFLHKPVPLNGNILYYVVNNKKEISDNIYVSDPRTLGFYKEDIVIRSVVVVPVMLDNYVSGLLYMDSEEEEQFSLDDMQMLRMYSQQISRLLNFAKYAQKSKTDAAHFSMMNNMVHSLASTLDFNEIMNHLVKMAKNLFSISNLFVVRVSENEGHIIFSMNEMINIDNESKFNINNNFIKLLENQKTVIIKNDLMKRDIKLHILYKGDEFKNSKSVIGLPIVNHYSTDLDYIIITSEEEMKISKTVESLFEFLKDVLQTAIEKARYYENMRDLAIKDGLTGIYNHRYFQEQLDFFMEQTKRVNRKLALIMMDIDYFKKFNDTYGHQIGDTVLKAVSSVLTDNIRSTDFIARYGGEEFVIILNNIESNVFETVEKLRKMIETKNIFIKETGEKLSVTASFGIAVFPDNAEMKNDLIKRSDDALYQAKEQGRNRTVIA